MEGDEMSLNFITHLDTDTVTIENDACAQQLLFSLNTLRQQNRFCDVTIEVDDHENNCKHSFYAHACVLVSVSSMMEAVLDKKPKQRTIYLKSLNRETLGLCLDYVYGCEVNIAKNKVETVLKASEMLQFQALVTHCKHVLDQITATAVQVPVEDSVLNSDGDFVYDGFDLQTLDQVEENNEGNSNIETRQALAAPVGECLEYVTDPGLKHALTYEQGPIVDIGETVGKVADIRALTAGETVSSQPSVREIVKRMVKKSGDGSITSFKVILKDPSFFATSSTAEKCAIKEEIPNTDPMTSLTDQSDQQSLDTKGAILEKDDVIDGGEESVIDPVQLIFCDHCAEYFQNLECYNRHQQEIALQTKPKSAVRGVKRKKIENSKLGDIDLVYDEERRLAANYCDHCDKNFATQKGLKEHKRRVELHVQKYVPSGRRKKAEEELDGDYLCPTCGDVVSGRDNIVAHKEEHKKKILCDHCNQFFSGQQNLKRHLERVKRNPNMRSPCFNKEESKARRKAYITELRSKTWVCDVCGEHSKNWSAYYRHKKTVHDKRYVCKFCNKIFITPKYLKNHEQRHTKEKNFFCSDCDAGFVMKSELDEHIDRRHSQMQLQCQMCTNIFKTNIGLRRHQREYHRKGVQQCPHCDYRGVESNLQRHLVNQHYPDRRKSWCCRVCGNKYTQKSHLDRHLMRMHQIAATPMVPFSVNNKALLEDTDEKDLSMPLTIEQNSNSSTAVPTVTASKALEIIEEYPANDFLIMDGSASNVFYLDQEIHAGEITEINIASQSCFS